jgi:crotonobetainyl-CoA:carnitine CoA-transferase CaiB-like acyl-CoA transferase
MAPLDGLRVIDLSRVLAGPFCAMLLGDMGADVIKIEEPKEGDDARMWGPFVGGWSAYFLGVNRNKRSVALDLKRRRAALRALLGRESLREPQARQPRQARLGKGLRALNPRLIHCSISGHRAESGLRESGHPDGAPVRQG